jgi:hypothetical protein
MTDGTPSEGLKAARFLMVLCSMTPLFVLWGIRGSASIPDEWLWIGCSVLIVIPNLALLARIGLSRRRKDLKNLTVGKADDHREHLLVYLFAMLIPLYDANLGSARDMAAALVAFVFIVFLFWYMNLHYMNVVFAVAGYRVFTIEPGENVTKMGGLQPFVLITKRKHLPGGLHVSAYRISNTVFFEP